MKYMKLLLTLALTVTCFAETHRFQPTEFYNTFSGAHTPVLRTHPELVIIDALRLPEATT
jgi:hypothetical protein